MVSGVRLETGNRDLDRLTGMQRDSSGFSGERAGGDAVGDGGVGILVGEDAGCDGGACGAPEHEVHGMSWDGGVEYGGTMAALRAVVFFWAIASLAGARAAGFARFARGIGVLGKTVEGKECECSENGAIHRCSVPKVS
jgi:hypothetical protein